jgi:autotransporter family porin
MATDTWEDGSGLWTDSADWSGGTPISTSNVVVSEGDPQITGAIAIASLSNSSAVSFINAGSSTISGAVSNLGFLNLDAGHGDGGSNLAIGGVLTNTGVLQFGDADGSLSKSDTVSAAGIVNTIGDIDLTGGATSADTMTFNVTGGTAGFGTAGTVSGDVAISGNAKIVFAGGGEITAIQGLSTLSLTGPDALIADAAHPYTNSALTSLSLVAGTLDLSGGAAIATTGALNNIYVIDLSSMAGGLGSSLTVGGALTNNGQINVDQSGAGSGGSSLVVEGALINYGQLSIGSELGFQSTTVTATTLNNIYGDIELSAGVTTAALTKLAVTTGPAGFGFANELLGDVTLTGDSAIVFASGQIGTIASGASLELDGATARIALIGNTAANSALMGLSQVNGFLALDSGAVLATGALTVGGTMEVDYNNVLGGFGGSRVSVGGTLTVNGTVDLGSYYLTTPDSILAQALTLNGSLNINGSEAAAERSLLYVTAGAAGFNGAGALKGDVKLTGDASVVFVSGSISSIFAGGSLSLDGTTALVADAAAQNANSALSGLDSIAGDLEIDDGAKITTTLAMSNFGDIDVDTDGDGGSYLKIGGALANIGEVNLGNSGMTAAGTVITTALNNTGSISITGGATAAGLMLLDVTTGTATFRNGPNLVGDISLSGEARIEFVSGAITAISSGNYLSLSGANAVISDSATPASNSALAGLASVGGTLALNDGAAITTTGSLTNTNSIDIDSSSYSKDAGGSRLTIGGTLTNASGATLDVGNSAMTSADVVVAQALSNQGTMTLFGETAPIRALIEVTTGTAGFGLANTLTGTVNLSGYSTIMFASGEITTIGAGDTLSLASATSYIEDGATNTNSALTGLAEIEGTLELSNGANLTTSGNLKNDQYIYVDSGEYGYGGSAGGSTLTVGAELINDQDLYIGSSSLTEAATVVVKTLNNTSGAITITGGATATARALLDVTTGTPSFGTAGVLSGDVVLSGNSGIEFASGSIATIQKGATLDLEGASAYVEDLVSNSNSALSGLTAVAGTLDLNNGAKITTTVGTAISGTVDLDSSYSDTGGGAFTVGGTLTVNSGGALDIGLGSLKAVDTVTANALVDTGSIYLDGGPSAAGNALLNIKGAAPASLAGSLSLIGHAAVDFASGGITTIASGGSLSLNGAFAYVADGATASNNALSGLATVDGDLSLLGGAKVSTTGPMAINDYNSVDVDDSYGAGGSSLTVGGLLTNGGYLNVGNYELSASDLVTLNSLTNNYEVELVGSAAANAEVAITGALINNSGFSVTADSETIAGAVSGTGTFSLTSYDNVAGALTFNNSVGSGESVSFGYAGDDTLTLNDAKAFAAAISDFSATGDTVNVGSFGTGTTQSFSGGVLTLTDGANVAHLNFGSTTSAELGVTVGTSSTVIKFV